MKHGYPPLPSRAAVSCTAPEAHKTSTHDEGQGFCLSFASAKTSDPQMPGWPTHPVDVQEYLRWINTASGHIFRLPTAIEWEQMAASVLPEEPDPLFADPSLTCASRCLTEGLTPRALRPQGSFSTSLEGIADLDGSVWEWTQECYAGVSEGLDPS
ncbi:MAG: formylglycine-generating enzyme family protein [Pelagibaca sp.]